MNDLNKKVISEVIDVLQHTDDEILIKIPQKFITFLYENADKDYVPNIDFHSENWEESLEEDTNAILALIYRDYIVSPNERNKLIKEENREKTKREEELRKKYNSDNIFNNRNNKIHNQQEEKQIPNIGESTQLVEVKQIPWYRKILNKLFNIFRRK